ncbi:hypothetical protein MKEN_00223600 [Mycena kentingensis (nom. inval.)]|nr:hypothetical protein MKEN_00223600 [Mycena kentingensis (nom. inval.)]
MLSEIAAELQNLFASILVGNLFNSMAYMLEILLAWQYYTKKRRTQPTRPRRISLRPAPQFVSPGADTTFVRWFVAVQLVVDTIGTLNNFAYGYMYLILHWGDLEFVAQTHWPAAVYCISSGLSGFSVQLYLIWRLGILSKNYLICGVLALASMGGLVGAILFGIHSQVSTNVLELVPLSMIWLIASVVADILIAAALVWELCKFKTTFRQTKSIIKRLIYSAIQTGCLTSLVAALVLITFIVNPAKNITLAFGFFLGRMYGCTLLFNLTTGRGRMGEVSDATHTHTHTTEERGYAGTRGQARPTATMLDTFGGIHVQRSVHVDKDDIPDVDDASEVAGADRKGEIL